MTPRELVLKIQESPKSNENIFEYHDKRVAMVEAFAEEVRRETLEQAARIVDQCNEEGPYNAIGAASRIRAAYRIL